MRRRGSVGALVGIAIVLFAGASDRARAAPTPAKVANAEYAPEFRGRVRKSIEQGLAYLRARPLGTQPESGIQYGRYVESGDEQEAAAIVWVLRRAGAPRTDPLLRQCSERMTATASAVIEVASLRAVALASPSLPDGDPFSLEVASRDAGAPEPLDPTEKKVVDDAVAFLLAKQRKPGGRVDSAFLGVGGWGLDTGPDPNRVTLPDMPATYLALVGLEAGARAGASLPRKAFRDALDLLLAWQGTKGPNVALKMNEVRGADRFEWTEKARARGFGFAGVLGDELPSGFETVGGAIGLIVCQDALQRESTYTKDLRQRTHAAIRDALAWVQENYDVSKDPVKAKPGAIEGLGMLAALEGEVFHYAWLQALSRLAIHGRMRFIGTHDWYQEGAEVLMKAQRKDGSWDAGWWSNCYALLFLMRSSARSTVPVVTDVDR